MRDIDTTESSESSHSSSSPSITVNTAKTIAVQALSLTVQDWRTLGQGTDPAVVESLLFDAATGLDTAVRRVSALLLVRIVALRRASSAEQQPSDFSTSGLCRLALIADEHPFGVISQDVLDQLRQYVRRILSGYSATLPFHNPQHAATVVVSCNKLLDLMLVGNDIQFEGKKPPSYGLRHSPLLLAATMFSALVHDVKHKGVKNSQLSLESDPIALLYNDRSIQEKNSLHFAFSELLKPCYDSLRCAMFGNDDGKYRVFRSSVITTVMATDLTCPEQTALTKSKWKEAFPPPAHFSKYRRGSVHSHMSRHSQKSGAQSHVSRHSQKSGRRNRRGSDCSDMSELTTDIGFWKMTASPNRSPRRSSMGSVSPQKLSMVATRRRSSTGATPETRQRRLSVGSNYQKWVHRRHLTVESLGSSDDDDDDYCVDSVVVMKKPKSNTDAIASGSDALEPCVIARTQSESTKDSYSISVAAESIGINHKRLEGGKVTRNRLLLNQKSERKLSGGSLGSQLSNNDVVDSASSFSATPPSSDDEYCGQVVAGVSSVLVQPTPARRASASAMIQFRRSSLSERPPADELSRRCSVEMGGRRDSASAIGFRKRLGIRRSIDFSGEAIEVYHNKRGSLGAMSALSYDEPSVHHNNNKTGSNNNNTKDDEMDYLKASAVMEALLRTADVGHFFQSWENMTQWTSRMFAELHHAAKEGRGSDPSYSWFDNQVKVMDLYLTPLALQLDECGVFDEQTGPMFADVVDEIKARWLVYGYELTAQLQRIDLTDGSSGLLSDSSRSGMFDLSDHTSVI